ncbi:unnamed protein product [Schistocephalus solidus]|uniref:Uncharacterized protein n=1 Tax=Schistocephalus solidus TaxID=70667 RepID=A0A183SRC9_SCHSO|nr:unnamed protein product [Schistocephalus solidus]
MDHQTDANERAFIKCRRLVQQRLRAMQHAWMVRKAEVSQGYVGRNEIKNVFNSEKAIYDPGIKETAPLHISDSTRLLMEKTQILKRWAEHFASFLQHV